MATDIVAPLSMDQLVRRADAVKKFTAAVGGISFAIFVATINLLVGDIGHDDHVIFPGALVQLVTKGQLSNIATHSGTAMVTVLFALRSSGVGACQQQGIAIMALTITILGQQSKSFLFCLFWDSRASPFVSALRLRPSLRTPRPQPRAIGRGTGSLAGARGLGRHA